MKFRTIVEKGLNFLIFVTPLLLLVLFLLDQIQLDYFLGGLSFIFATVSITYFLNPKDAPEIGISLNPRNEWVNFIDFEIVNAGKVAAYNIKFKVNEHLKKETFMDISFSESSFIKEGIPFLKPSGSLKFFLLNLVEKPDLNWDLNLTITYEDNYGTESEVERRISLKHFRNYHQIGKPPINEISDTLKDINHSLSKFFRYDPSFKVITYTPKYLENKKKEEMKKYSKRP